VLHIEGAMLYSDDAQIFEDLINATALPKRCE
jgi:hypothetical protein